MEKVKINLIGSSLYSILIALKLSKYKKFKISIYEKSPNFLNAFSSIKIENYFCNPGFHAFEGIRSHKILNYLKKEFSIKFKKKQKSRGLIIGDDLIDSRIGYNFWPNRIIKKYKLKPQVLKVNNRNSFNINKKYIKYLHKNLGNNLEIENTLQLIYPWFFPNNYRTLTKDEGLNFLDKVRTKKINHTYYVPLQNLFANMINLIKKKLIKEKIKIYLNKDIKFFRNKEGEVEVNLGKKKMHGISIVTLPIFSVISSILDYDIKVKKLKKNKYYTALVKADKSNILNDFSEIIVSSHKTKGLRRISNYSFLNDLKSNIYQFEFLEDPKFKSVEIQINSYINEITKIINLNTNQNIVIKLVGFKFLRYIFSPKNKYLNDLIIKLEKYFKKSSKVFIPRNITWPINTNKQYIFSETDVPKILKLL